MATVKLKVDKPVPTLQQRVDEKQKQVHAAQINLDLATAVHAKYSLQLDGLLGKLKKEIDNA